VNPSTNSIPGRDARQQLLVPAEWLARCVALMIGVGAIGRQVALQLAALGISRLVLHDDDQVEAENLTAQDFWPEDLQKPKVHATARLCRRIHPSMQMSAVPERFKRSTANALAVEGELAVFCCVDSIRTRRMLWESLQTKASCFFDGRMHGEVMRVLASATPAVDDAYARTLFAAEEAHVGPCTARSTIYTASIAAGLMVHQFTRWLRGVPIDRDLTLNLLAAELTATGAA
jgi:molybdopterin/thiamine biosynthesis adenylyltransferase